MADEVDFSEMRRRMDSLSPRQREILIYVAQHLSSKEIGRLLGVSAPTVDSHIAAALQRLELKTRRDAAIYMIDLGYTSGLPDPHIPSSPSVDHHGGDQRTNLQTLPSPGSESISPLSERSRSDLSEGGLDETQIRATGHGMAQVVVRYLLDGFYIILFFSIMSAVALGAHWVVIQCEQQQIDPVVLYILKGASYLLVGLDAIGVVTATGLLTYRFIRAIARADE